LKNNNKIPLKINNPKIINKKLMKMASNSLGDIFRITTFGESHGKAIGAVIDGCPANIEISEEDIQKELDRRRPGQSEVTSARKEEDKAEILSGIFEGRTTGAQIAIVIFNKNIDSSGYEKIKDLLRPGHANFTYLKKYGIFDYKGGGRSSGRETANWVAGGAVAKKILAEKGIRIIAYAKEIGGIKAEEFDIGEIDRNDVRCPDKNAARKMVEKILEAKNDGDSIGGVIEVAADNVPAGLGDPVFNKLDAEIAKALMTINGVKGVEIGAGFEAAKMKGSECNDAFAKEGEKIITKTNNSGGILGGISNGMPITARIAVKPTSSIGKEQETTDLEGNAAKIKVEGKHDPCLVPRAVPVVEAMMALVLVNAYLRQKIFLPDRK